MPLFRLNLMWKFKHSDLTMAPSMLTWSLVPSCQTRASCIKHLAGTHLILYEGTNDLVNILGATDVHHECAQVPMEWSCHDGHLLDQPHAIPSERYEITLWVVFVENIFSVPPKVFNCTCFVRDHRPSVNKSYPRAVSSDICQTYYSTSSVWCYLWLWWHLSAANAVPPSTALYEKT